MNFISQSTSIDSEAVIQSHINSVLGSNLPHTVASRYNLGDVIGTGGFSEVRLGVSNNALQQKVAVKIVTRSGMTHLDEISLQNEVSILENLKHPNIVRQLDFFHEEDKFYIILEYLDGGELFNRIVEKTCFNEKEARDCILHVLRALKYCHDRNIVHRDLKPENLLLSNKDKDLNAEDLKLADFGFAVFAEGDDLTELVGTPDYIAPEILSKKRYGKAVDMWSLGVVMYILLGGYAPFADESMPEQYRKIRRGLFEFHVDYWSDVSEQAKDLISRLLVVDPSRRLTADQALQHPWMLNDTRELEQRNLDTSLNHLRKHLVRRKFKGAVKAVISVGKNISSSSQLCTYIERRMKNLLRGKADSSSPTSKDIEVQHALKRTEAYLKCILGENLPHTIEARYTVEDTVLGEGGFSEVRSGVSKTALQQKVAVKIVDRKKLSAVEEESLRNEVAILEKMKHPHILRQLDFFEQPDHYYIVLEYLGGGELFNRIVAKTYFNEKEARDCVMHVLKAVKYCHDHNIVHRDLKPENLLLTSKDEDADLKLADFGFAVYAEGDTLTEQLGTPDYMAPEILSRIPYGKAVDMWSLGIVVYILLGGYLPFSGATQAKLFRNIQSGVFEFHTDYWKDVSEEAKDFISSLIEVDPSKRLTADQAFEHPWLTKDGHELEKLNLDANLTHLRKHLAARKLKGVVKSVMAVNRMKRILKESSQGSYDEVGNDGASSKLEG